MLYYYLMNKDIKVLKFKVQKINNITDYSIVEIYRQNLIPRDLTNLYNWIDKRHILNYRNSISVFFSMLGIKDLSDFIDITHCVSLSDTYWIKGCQSKLRWNSVSPYHNPLNKTISDYSFNRIIRGKNITGSPDFSTDGNFPKCWKRENGQLVLIKAGSSGASNAGLEPYSEVYAYNVAKMLGISKVVRYDIGKYKGVTVSRCKCFTSENIGLLPYSVIAGTTETNFYNFLYKDRLFESTDKLDMLLLDYLTCNVDRHYGNIGVLKNNDSNKILGLSPIYDNNLSCLPYYTVDESLSYYISDILAKDGSSWGDLFKLLYSFNPEYIRRKLILFRNCYKMIRINSKRDSIVDEMIKIQIKRVVSIISGKV